MSSKDVASTTNSRRFLRRVEVEHRTGFKRAHIYTLMRAGKFPQAVRLGVRAVGWDSSEIEQWIEARLKARGETP
jgi:prophage regulatory protein